jgi:hypothetical protein
MSNLQQIAARRAALIEKAAHQRAELGALCRQFHRPAAMFDKGCAMACRIKSHPGLVIGATAVLALILIKRGAVGKLAGVAVKVAKFAVPVARVWSSLKLSRQCR